MWRTISIRTTCRHHHRRPRPRRRLLQTLFSRLIRCSSRSSWPRLSRINQRRRRLIRMAAPYTKRQHFSLNTLNLTMPWTLTTTTPTATCRPSTNPPIRCSRVKLPLAICCTTIRRAITFATTTTTTRIAVNIMGVWRVKPIIQHSRPATRSQMSSTRPIWVICPI